LSTHRYIVSAIQLKHRTVKEKRKLKLVFRYTRIVPNLISSIRPRLSDLAGFGIANPAEASDVVELCDGSEIDESRAILVCSSNIDSRVRATLVGVRLVKSYRYPG